MRQPPAERLKRAAWPALAALALATGLFRPPALPPPARTSIGYAYLTHPWHVVEITLVSSRTYNNPFLDVDVTAIFIGPNGASLVRAAFWDGGNIWKVRMAPTGLGVWQYHIIATDPGNAGLNPPAGQVVSLPTGSDLAIYQHGFLRVSPNERYLTYADGTPFFWLGDTHWFFDSKERWDSANKPGWTSEFKGMVDRRVAQHFTVYQSVIFGPSPSYWAPGKVGELINPEYFRDNLDRKMQYIADQGLVNAFGLGFHSNIDGHVTAEVRLAKYVVARYGALPMVWITAGEVAGYDPALRQARLDGWREVALEIFRDDTYHQPQTAHYTKGWPTDYQGEGWLDFTMVQGSHGSLPPTSVYAQYYDQAAPVPLLEGELNYEQLFPSITPTMVRASAYRAIQAGSFGYTYGAQGIWNATWDNSDTSNDSTYVHVNWFDAIDYLGATQMGYMADFYTSLPWQTLVPRPSGWATWNLALPDPSMPVVKADDAGQNIVVYFPDGYNPTDLAGILKPLPNLDYRVRWFNPRTNFYTVLGTAHVTDQQWLIETKPDPGDWVLSLQAVKSGPEQSLRPQGADLALHQTYQASSQVDAAHAPALAFDGNSETAWQAAPGQAYSAQWLEVDFNSPVTIAAAAVSETGNRTRRYQIQYWNGGGWAVAATGTLIASLPPTVSTFGQVTTTRALLQFMAGVYAPIINELAFFQSQAGVCGLIGPSIYFPPDPSQPC